MILKIKYSPTLVKVSDFLVCRVQNSAVLNWQGKSSEGDRMSMKAVLYVSLIAGFLLTACGAATLPPIEFAADTPTFLYFYTDG